MFGVQQQYQYWNSIGIRGSAQQNIRIMAAKMIQFGRINSWRTLGRFQSITGSHFSTKFDFISKASTATATAKAKGVSGTATTTKGNKIDCSQPTNDDDLDEMEEMFIMGPAGMEWNGPTRGGSRPEPTRYGDWERKGRASDF